jgi:tetratricopeptide (TPR) repeat protein
MLVALIIATIMCSALAFFAGYQAGGKGARSRKTADALRLPAALPPDSPARATALDLLDQAYAARFEGRQEDAVELLRRARSADPLVPGADLVAAEIAFDARNFSDLRKFTARAAKQEHYAGQAHALLGLEKWLTRNTASVEASSSEEAKALFATACRESPYDPLVLFFYGDILRESGQHDEGKRRALEAVYRLHPWHSALVVSLKAALAADEARLPLNITDSPVSNAPARDAVLALRNAVRAGSDAQSQSSALRRFVTVGQLELLASDSAFEGGPHGFSSLFMPSGLARLPGEVSLSR